jgi:hypothetical protein
LFRQLPRLKCFLFFLLRPMPHSPRTIYLRKASRVSALVTDPRYQQAASHYDARQCRRKRLSLRVRYIYERRHEFLRLSLIPDTSKRPLTTTPSMPSQAALPVTGLSVHVADCCYCSPEWPGAPFQCWYRFFQLGFCKIWLKRLKDAPNGGSMEARQMDTGARQCRHKRLSL